MLAEKRRPTPRSLRFSFLFPRSVPRWRDEEREIEDRGGKRETDKRIVLILEPLALPYSTLSHPNTLPTIVMNPKVLFGAFPPPPTSPLSLRPFLLLFPLFSRLVRNLSSPTLFSFLYTVIGRSRIMNSSRHPVGYPLLRVTPVDLELEICRPRVLLSFFHM